MTRAASVTRFAFPLLAVIAVLPTSAVTWREALRKDADWLRTDEGKRVVENVLFYQYPSGGWPKNTDMAAPLDEATREAFARRRVEAIIDNGATFSQIRFLARAYAATGDEPAKAACLRGLQFLFDAQYENGGWPMVYPLQRSRIDGIRVERIRDAGGQ